MVEDLLTDQRQVRSFVRRGGRMGPELEAARTHVLPTLAPGEGTWDRAEVFPDCRALVVEVGSGMGEATLAMAKADPDTGIIAVEVHDRGVAALARGVAAAQLRNVRIHVGDAVAALSTYVPRSAVDEIRIWFPDPWPKKRHHKRRLITDQFVHLAASRLVPGGRLHIATDHADYAEWIAGVLAEQRWMDPELVGGPRPPWRPMTRFEASGLKAGRDVSDFIYKRTESR